MPRTIRFLSRLRKRVSNKSCRYSRQLHRCRSNKEQRRWEICLRAVLKVMFRLRWRKCRTRIWKEAGRNLSQIPLQKDRQNSQQQRAWHKVKSCLFKDRAQSSLASYLRNLPNNLFFENFTWMLRANQKFHTKVVTQAQLHRHSKVWWIQELETPKRGLDRINNKIISSTAAVTQKEIILFKQDRIL